MVEYFNLAMMKRIICVAILMVALSLFQELFAQCPMCRIAAESNLEHGGTAGKGLNMGILYMLMMPYALVGILGFIWYKNRKRSHPLAGPSSD